MIVKLRKSEYRCWSLKYLMNNVGRGPKKALKYIKVNDQGGEVIKTIHNRTELEEVLIEQSKKYFTKAIKTKAYEDKIYKRLLDDKVRDKIMKGKLISDEYTNKEVYEFLKLFHQHNGIQYSMHEYEKIEVKE